MPNTMFDLKYIIFLKVLKRKKRVVKTSRKHPYITKVQSETLASKSFA